MSAEKDKKLITIKVDGESVTVPSGINLVEAVRYVGVEVPHYCYHPHLPIAGNCRMCQLEIKGQSKLVIGCNTVVEEGMEIYTHCSSERVRAAQAATLEFLLINHPLDCTVCDQAGHCKLQDYHYQYNLKPSSFDGQKVHKNKAVPLGPNVIFDAERCILCTRCVRFCHEVTETKELGVFKRGTRSEIGIVEGKELDNPFSGTVVDLCPVGALTHRKWRFASRIWFTKETDSICPGCSTGCNVKVAVRQDQIVLVKARLNSQVNQEWLCDRGRYGFDSYLPGARLLQPLVEQEVVGWEDAMAQLPQHMAGKTLVMLSPDIHLEDYALLKIFFEKHIPKSDLFIPKYEKQLTPLEAKLISPLSGANYHGAQYIFGNRIEGDETLIANKITKGDYQNLIFIGDRSVSPELVQRIAQIDRSVFNSSLALVSSLESLVIPLVRVVLPVRAIIEQSGLLLNKDKRLQYAAAVVPAPQGVMSLWEIINRYATSLGKRVVEAGSDYERTQWYCSNNSKLKDASLADLSLNGLTLP